jgi:hypothetical protein
LILSVQIHSIGGNIRKVERSFMKVIKVLSVPVLIGLMYLALFAQEPQGRGGQPGGGPPQQGGGPPRGGGGGPKNVQVLGGADLPATMQSFVQALGLLDKGTCNYCHADDKSSDEKKPKQVARRMVVMVRAINGTFGDGKQHVTCYTCHRGNTTPLTEPAAQ